MFWRWTLSTCAGGIAVAFGTTTTGAVWTGFGSIISTDGLLSACPVALTAAFALLAFPPAFAFILTCLAFLACPSFTFPTFFLALAFDLDFLALDLIFFFAMSITR